MRKLISSFFTVLLLLIFTQDLLADNPIYSLAISPNSKILVSGQSKGLVNFWSLSQHKLLYSIRSVSKKDIISLAFSSDGTKIVTSAGEIWNISTRKLVKQMKFPSIPELISIDRTGNLIATKNETKVSVWNSKDGKLLYELPHDDSITAFTFSPIADLILTGGNDHYVKLWNSKTGELIHNFDEHIEQITFAAFVNQGAQIASGCKDGVIKFWNVENYELTESFEPEEVAQTDGISNDGKVVFSYEWSGSGEGDTSLEFYSFPPKSLISSFDFLDMPKTQRVEFSKNNYIVAVARNACINLLSRPSLKVVSRLGICKVSDSSILRENTNAFQDKDKSRRFNFLSVKWDNYRNLGDYTFPRNSGIVRNNNLKALLDSIRAEVGNSSNAKCLISIHTSARENPNTAASRKKNIRRYLRMSDSQLIFRIYHDKCSAESDNRTTYFYLLPNGVTSSSVKEDCE